MAPSMSFGVSPASLMASRAASAATMRSERPGCAPATTPSPIIAYRPDDGCLGTAPLPLPCSVFLFARLGGIRLQGQPRKLAHQRVCGADERFIGVRTAVIVDPGDEVAVV